MKAFKKQILIILAALFFLYAPAFAETVVNGVETGGSGSGDMLAATYDADSNNKVDDADAVTAANEAADTTCFPLFVTAATGSLAPKTNAGLFFNSATGMLGATYIGATGTRVTKGFYTDLEITNAPTIGGAAMSTIFLPLSTIVAAGDIIVGSGAGAVTVVTKNAGTAILGTSGGTLGYYTSISQDDSAAQFLSATASKGTRKLVQSSISDGILLTDTPIITGNVTWTNISQGAGTYTRVFEEALNVFTVLQQFDATAGIKIGATGVLITSDDDGAITFLGTSAGFNESLTINLDDTENTAVVSSASGVTKVDFSAINLATTGYVDAGVLVSKVTDATITVSGMATYYVNADDDAIAFNLPADGTNKCFCFANVLYARAITVNPDDADYIVHAGTTAAAGEDYVSSGARTDQVCLIGIDSSYWQVSSERGTWAEETP